MSSRLLVGVLSAALGALALASDAVAAEATATPEDGFKALYSVTFVDADRGWAVGRSSVILRTVDGGVSWTVQHRSEGIEERELMGVAFLDPARGVAVGKKGLLLTTSDGGESWAPTARFRSPRRLFLEARMAAEDKGFQAWRAGAVLACEQAKSAAMPAEPVAPAEPVVPPAECVLLEQKIAEFDARRAELMEAWNQTPALWPAGAMESFDFTSVQAIGPNSLLALGEGILFFSDDAGSTWTAMRDVPDAARFGWFEDRYHGWVVGHGGYVGRTGDGCQTWIDRSVPEQWTLGAAFFLDGLNGWVGGESGALFSTGDGGASWKRLKTGTQQFIRQVRFLDRELGFAATWDGMLFTQDGGASWRPVPLPSNLVPGDASEKPDALAVAELGGKSAILVGSYGLVMRTDDGGATWRGLRGAAKWDRDFRAAEGGFAKRAWGVDAELGYVQPVGTIFGRYGPGLALNFGVFALRSRFRIGGGFFMNMVSTRERIVAPAEETEHGEAFELEGSGLYFQIPVATQFLLFERRHFVLQGLVGVGFVYHGFSVSDRSAEKITDEDGYGRDRVGVGSIQALSFGWYGTRLQRALSGPRVHRAGFYVRVGVQESWTWSVGGVQVDLGTEDDRRFGTEWWPFIGLGGGFYE